MDTRIVLVRHGQTEWSRDGRHTGRTDIDLTEQGRHEATLVAPSLEGWGFAHAFSSPLRRARDTAEISALADEITIDPDLVEWDYGVYEGRRTVDIRIDQPGWDKWTDVMPEGETADDVGRRADGVVDRVARAADDGPVILFAHGHLLAILIARWLGLPAADGRRFVLETATVSVLGTHRDDRVIRLLNHRCGSLTVPR